MMVRNKIYDIGLFRSASFDIPIICVGNLSAGGTGKTPHIEYLIRLLKDRFMVATLSRGYGRDSSGYLIASKCSNYKYIGDEPMQLTRKFPDIKVAVDAKREHGIRSLLSKYPSLNVILLDDAFQHRSVKPGLSILLTDYRHLYTEDHVLPSGMLREFPSGAKRADIIIVTKTPKVFSPITRRRIIEELKPTPRQHLFFSYIRYCDPVPAFEYPIPFQQRYSYIIIFTGIADDEPLSEHLERKCTELVRMKFRDHHPFTLDDVLSIQKKYDDLPTQKKAIVTTEKDLMRLRSPEFTQILKTMPVFYIPILMEFHGTDGEQFDKTVLTYLETSSRVH